MKEEVRRKGRSVLHLAWLILTQKCSFRILRSSLVVSIKHVCVSKFIFLLTVYVLFVIVGFAQFYLRFA